MEKRRVISYTKTCQRNPEYPKVRRVCGQVERVKSPDQPIERWAGDWRLLAYVRDA